MPKTTTPPHAPAHAGTEARRPNPHRKKPVPIAAAFGERVKRLRAERDYSFDAFVEETELGRGYISELERGMVVPSLTTLVRLAAALEMTVAELMAFGASTLEELVEVSRGLSHVQQRRLLREARRMMKHPPAKRVSRPRLSRQ